MEKQLLRSLCDWILDKELSIHIVQDKTKSISFDTKSKLRNAKALNNVYSS